MSEKITVYGAHWCGPCTMVKKYLNDHNIPYDYIDIDKAPEAMPEGYRSIPIIQVDNEFHVGYDKKVLSSLANQNLQ